ncbi:hypothetical protein KA005_52385 [bacterium]|nr:hypothetical protein [bacterium]
MKIVIEKDSYADGEARETHRKVLQRLGDFFGAAEVRYGDYYKREEYILIRDDGSALCLTAKGNGFDGGWLNISVVGEDDG